jgi:hypothetical protein
MSEMVNNVAAAIYERRRRGQSEPVPFEELYPRARQPYLDEARAAIEAMRKPTKHMVDAAYAAYDRFEESSEGAWCGFSSAYQAMIDATLRVSDENPKGENAERSRGEALPARCHNVTDALTPSLSPKEQKGE